MTDLSDFIRIEHDPLVKQLNDRVAYLERRCLGYERGSLPATPVDCLLSELRDLFTDGVLWRDEFEHRVAQFNREVGRA